MVSQAGSPSLGCNDAGGLVAGGAPNTPLCGLVAGGAVLDHLRFISSSTHWRREIGSGPTPTICLENAGVASKTMYNHQGE